MTNTPRILLADDQPDVLEALRLLLKTEGFVTETVNSPDAVIRALASSRGREFDLMLIDLNYTRDTTSGMEGLELIRQVRRLDETLPVVVMTAWGSIELAVEAMRDGGGDFIQKPWDNQRLLSVLRTQLERGRALRREKQEKLSRERAKRYELDEAHHIQESLLPTTLPQLTGLDLAASWQPAREVSGDYYDVLKLSENKVAICIADVEGKGLPAAMLMANLQAAVRSIARQTVVPNELCEHLNRAMLQNSAGTKLISLCYALMDTSARRLQYVNAGHFAPLLVRADGQCERLEIGGTVLRVMADTTYEMGEVELQSGDRLMLFTDGVIECCNEAGEEFGEERLHDVVRDNRTLNAAALQQAVKQAINEFSNGNFQDDVTMMVVGCE